MIANIHAIIWLRKIFEKNFLVAEIYKYKRQLKKCVGVITLKKGDSFDINWTYLEGDFTYSEQMENWVKQDNEAYGPGEIAELTRNSFFPDEYQTLTASHLLFSRIIVPIDCIKSSVE